MAATTKLKAIIEAEDRASSVIGKVGGTYGKLASTVLKVGIAMQAAVAGFGGYAIKLASDLAEVQNVVDVTFGTAGAKQINEWSRQAMKAFGLTEMQAKQFTGTMGAMLKSMGLNEGQVADMSKKLAGLTGDFASFYNLPHEEAFMKIRSGISGETEPLKQLGINMSVANLEAFALTQGIKKQYDAMTEAEKATLRYNYLMKVSADAQGDFTRTSGGFANQMRLLKGQLLETATTIGTALLPITTKLLTRFQEILPPVLDLAKGFAFFVVEGDFANDFITSFMSNLGLSWEQWKGLARTMEELRLKIIELAQGGFKLLIDTGKWLWENVIVPLADIIETKLIPAFMELWPSIQKITIVIIEIAQAIIGILISAFNAMASAIQAFLVPVLKELYNEILLLWQENKDWLIPLLKNLAMIIGVVLVVAIGILLIALAAIINIIRLVINIIREAIAFFVSFGRSIGDFVSGAVGLFINFKNAASDAFNSVKGWVQGLLNKLGELRGGISSIIGKIGEMAGKIAGVAGKIPGFASGTSYAPGGWAMVGENGPEMVNLPRGSKVETAGNTSNNTNFGGVTINISGAGDPRAVAYEVKRMLSRDNLTAQLGLNPSLS